MRGAVLVALRLLLALLSAGCTNGARSHAPVYTGHFGGCGCFLPSGGRSGSGPYSGLRRCVGRLLGAMLSRRWEDHGRFFVRKDDCTTSCISPLGHRPACMALSGVPPPPPAVEPECAAGWGVLTWNIACLFNTSSMQTYSRHASSFRGIWPRHCVDAAREFPLKGRISAKFGAAGFRENPKL